MGFFSDTGRARTSPAAPVRASSVNPDFIQAAIAGLRADLLGGRGAGASPSEVAQNTRARVRLGRESTPDHLAVVSRQTDTIRGDEAALALDSAASRDRMVMTLRGIRREVGVSRRRGIVGVGIGLATIALLRFMPRRAERAPRSAGR